MLSTFFLILHAAAVVMLVAALGLDTLSIYRWWLWILKKDDTPGYGFFPLIGYIAFSLLWSENGKSRLALLLLLISLHIVVSQLLPFVLRLIFQKIKIARFHS